GQLGARRRKVTRPDLGLGEPAEADAHGVGEARAAVLSDGQRNLAPVVQRGIEPGGLQNLEGVGQAHVCTRTLLEQRCLRQLVDAAITAGERARGGIAEGGASAQALEGRPEGGLAEAWLSVVTQLEPTA